MAAIAHIRCAALLLPARTTMLTTYGSRGPVLACLFAQATAFFGLSLNEHSDMLMASETVLFSSFTSEDDPHIDLKRMASGSAWSVSHALWGTARRSGRQGAWACACRGDMYMYKSRVAEYRSTVPNWVCFHLSFRTDDLQTAYPSTDLHSRR